LILNGSVEKVEFAKSHFTDSTLSIIAAITSNPFCQNFSEVMSAPTALAISNGGSLPP